MTWILFDFDSQNRKLQSGYEHLKENVLGSLVLPNGYRAVYGIYPMHGLDPDSAIGGYSKEVDYTSYGLSEPVWAVAAPRYPMGMPKVTIVSATSTKIKLGCDINNAAGSIAWMVIG